MLKPNSIQISRLCSCSSLKGLLGLGLLLCISGSAIADQQDESDATSNISNDLNKPIEIKSGESYLDGKNKSFVFVNNVVIRQGSLEILADRLEYDATKGDKIDTITATGKPASYTQMLDDGSLVSASANEIVYIVDKRTVTLKGNAAITQNDVEVNGDLIAFDMAKEKITSMTDENSEESVTTVINPSAFSDDDKKKDKNDNQ